MPPTYHVGLAIWPRKSAQWFELGLQPHPHVRTSPLGDETPESAVRLDLILVDGDNPGPGFLPYYTAYTRSFGPTDLIVLGQPGCPALHGVAWEPHRTTFLPKPYLIEQVIQTILRRLESLSEVPEPPAPAGPLPSRSEPVVPPPPPRARGKSLGYLSTLRLADLIQMLCLSSWSGRIDIEHLGTGDLGMVHIDDGSVIDARQADLNGAPAIYRMLSWGRCQFEFSEDAPAPERTIQVGWQGLLLEGARLHDEGALP